MQHLTARRVRQALPALGLLLALAAPCQAHDASAEALAQIDHLIGAARCTSDRQCRVAGVGQRPCGGPEVHRAWSKRDTPARLLQPQLQRYADMRRRQHESEGLLSTCQVLPEPAVRCERTAPGVGRCVLQGANDAIR